MSVLKSCSALEAYRKAYVDQVAPWKVAEFFITHAGFPRSIRFCVDFLDEALHCISGSDESRYANEAERLSGRLRSDLDYVTIGEIFKFGLHEYLTSIQERLVEINNATYDTYLRGNTTAETTRSRCYGLQKPEIPTRAAPRRRTSSQARPPRDRARTAAWPTRRVSRSGASPRPTSEPSSDPAKTLKSTARQPRNAPIAREEFQVAAPHRFARNLQLAHHAGDLSQRVELQDFVRADGHAVVVETAAPSRRARAHRSPRRRNAG